MGSFLKTGWCVCVVAAAKEMVAKLAPHVYLLQFINNLTIVYVFFVFLIQIAW